MKLQIKEDTYANNTFLDKFVSDYNDACVTAKALQNRLSDIDIVNVDAYQYGDALDAFKDVVCALQWLTAQITGIKRGDALLPTEQDFQRDVNSFNKFAAYFTKCLNNLEK